MFEDWTEFEKQLFAVNTTLVALDYATTYDLIHKREGFIEANPLLGKDPSKDKLVAFFLSKIIISYIVAEYNPKYRRNWLIFITSSSTVPVAHNISIGAQLRF